jgi:hypothetical protein
MSLVFYINEFFRVGLHAQELPIIVFTEDDLKQAKEILASLNIPINNIVYKKDIVLSCAHYPYTCGEVPLEHDDSSYWAGGCSCVPSFKRACKRMDPERSYIPFSWKSEYMKHDGNCYDDCCCKSKVFDRYAIYL